MFWGVMGGWTFGICCIPIVGLFIFWILAIWFSPIIETPLSSKSLTPKQTAVYPGILKERVDHRSRYTVFGKDNQLVFWFYRGFLFLWIFPLIFFINVESGSTNDEIFFWGPFVFIFSILLALITEIVISIIDRKHKRQPDTKNQE
jgi:hypothetical protein